MSVYVVGEDDPTPDDMSVEDMCGAESRAHYVCTWPAGHGGQHVAGTGEYVAAVWDEVCPECGALAGWHWVGCELRPRKTGEAE